MRPCCWCCWRPRASRSCACASCSRRMCSSAWCSSRRCCSRWPAPTWRFARYYTGAPAYRRKGPPPVLLRLLGPVVVILTLVLLFSGVGLLLVSRLVAAAAAEGAQGQLRAVVRRHDHPRARPPGRGVPAGPAGLAAPDPARGHRGRNPPVADRRQPGSRRACSDFSCSVTWATGYQPRRARVSSSWVPF